MSAVRSRFLAALLCVGLLAVVPVASASAATSAKSPPRARAASCQLLGGRLVPVGAQERHLTACLDGSVMSSDLKACLTAVGISIPFVVVGGIIGGVAARGIAGAMVGGGGLGCVNAIR